MKRILSILLALTILVSFLSSCAGEAGADGINGKSAYEIAQSEGFSGTVTEWLASLVGKSGKKADGPEIVDGNWWIDDTDTGVKATGTEVNIDTTKEKPLAGKTIVNFGDSIIGTAALTGTDISSYLAQITGATVYNCGFGGCRMSSYLPRQQWDAFSMYRIAYAITSRDFSYQEASFDFDDGGSKFPSYFRNHFETLKSIDFNEVDIITISYGANDFTASRGEEDYTMSFQGSLRYSIESILTAYPHINIYLCTPTWRTWLNDEYEVISDSDTKRNDKGGKRTDYVQYVKDVGAEYNLPVIDNYYELGFNHFTRSVYFPKTDGAHPNERGRYLYAKHLAENIF